MERKAVIVFEVDFDRFEAAFETLTVGVRALKGPQHLVIAAHAAIDDAAEDVLAALNLPLDND